MYHLTLWEGNPLSKQTAVMFTHEGDSPSFAFDSGKPALGISGLWRRVLLGGTWVRRFQGGGHLGDVRVDLNSFTYENMDSSS